MNLVQTSFVFAVLCFTIQIIVNIKSDKKLIKWLPLMILSIFSALNLIYWLTGIGTYEYNDIISGKEADALYQGIIMCSGMAGCVVAGFLSLFKRK